MVQYARGDVVLASISIDDRSSAKIRPAIVIETGENGEVIVCPVSSRPPFDAPGVPISLDDFAEGGLDLFNESYVMTSRIRTIRNRDLIGKKGRLTSQVITEIAVLVSDSSLSSKKTKKRSG
jgi:mRNA interferase MazF